MSTQPDDDNIRMLAYQIWESRGRPHGDPESDWQEAVRKLRSEEQALDESGMETFPASDPPSTHLGDDPPSNARDLWNDRQDAGNQNVGNGQVATGAWLPSLDN